MNYSKKNNTDNIFNAIHDRNTLQQAQITELTETMFSVSTLRMKDQQQSFRPLVIALLTSSWRVPLSSGLVSDGRRFSNF